MIDIAAIWAASKATVEASKTGLELAKKAEHQDLIEHAQNMRDQVLDLKAHISDLREYITELEEKQKLEKILIWNEKCWEYQKDDKIFYVCPGCKADDKISHMTFTKGTHFGDMVRCQKCSAEIYF